MTPLRPSLALLVFSLCNIAAFALPAAEAPRVPPVSLVPRELEPALVCAYDFEHPSPDDAARELDRGLSGTALWLVNGGAAMRVPDDPRGGEGHALQTRQIAPDRAGDDDWKAGVFASGGVDSLAAFASAPGVTLAGWVKPDGPTLRPALNTTTPAPDDRYFGIGLFGVLHGRSDGHPVRALIELIPVEGSLRLIALGRRLDDGAAWVVAAEASPDELLPAGRWTHLAASFDYARGVCVLYRDGQPVKTLPTPSGDPWALDGVTAEARLASPTAPTGLKIGGSHPQNTRERNPFDGRFDELLFFNRALDAAEIRALHRHATGAGGR